MRHFVPPAPQSRIPADRRGAVVGRFCHGCLEVYPTFAARHAGKPSWGKDLVPATCPYEGRPFRPEETWWEPAVEVLAPAPLPEAAASA